MGSPANEPRTDLYPNVIYPVFDQNIAAPNLPCQTYIMCAFITINPENLTIDESYGVNLDIEYTFKVKAKYNKGDVVNYHFDTTGYKTFTANASKDQVLEYANKRRVKLGQVIQCVASESSKAIIKLNSSLQYTDNPTFIASLHKGSLVGYDTYISVPMPFGLSLYTMNRSDLGFYLDFYAGLDHEFSFKILSIEHDFPDGALSKITNPILVNDN